MTYAILLPRYRKERAGRARAVQQAIFPFREAFGGALHLKISSFQDRDPAES